MKKRFIENALFALFVSLVIGFVLFPIWCDAITSAEALAGFGVCILGIFVATYCVRFATWIIILHNYQKKMCKQMKYEARNGRQDANRLGYISTETICEVVKRERRNGK